MPKKKKSSKKSLAGTKVIGSAERTIRHMRISDQMHADMKSRAAKQGITLNDFYDEACEWFLRHRAKKTYDMYLAPLNRGKYRSFWVDSRLIERIDAVAERDDVAGARVIFTALTLFLKEK